MDRPLNHVGQSWKNPTIESLNVFSFCRVENKSDVVVHGQTERTLSDQEALPETGWKFPST